MNIHEEMFARHFIKPAKRERYLALLQSEKGRSKLRFGLNHCDDIDMRYATLIPKEQQYEGFVLKLLKRKGAPELCHVMSSSSEIDEQDMPLLEALEKTMGWGSGTLISCLPGRLAYFEYEDQGERYILEHEVHAR